MPELDPDVAFKVDRDAWYDEWDGNIRSLPSSAASYTRGWADARRRYDLESRGSDE